MRAADIVSLLIGAAMIVFYFTDVLPRLGPALTSPPLVAFYWVLIAVFIAPPIARLFSEKLLGSVFGGKAGKLTREYSRAKSLAARGRFEEAIAEYRRGLENEPENQSLRLELAEIYSQHLHDYSKAIKEYEGALKMELRDFERASILNRIADVYESGLEDEEMAVRTLSRIVDALPGTKFAEKAEERIERTKRGQPPGKDTA